MSVYQNELTCKPLDTYSEIMMFLQNPPAWRTLCKELTPHSEHKIKNSDINSHEYYVRTSLDGPDSFCHYDPDTETAQRYNENNLPKTLVCHDMANGYHDDSIIDGTCNYDAYTFYNWAGIDIFCYFSHHLITIPPLSWINVGHAHGVKVIGTVITEWAEGIEFWDDVLQSEHEYKTFASALVAIAKTLKFDGWLLNVENKITKPDVLLEFVQYLHAALHRELPAPVLIWYDSVTIEGRLNWQNALNDKNRAFFDACDGLFTNYSWTPEDVEESAAQAGERLTDLYIGIDVWGRNFFGGGQFNINEAVALAAGYGCSLAIFAPAWTHEACSLESGDANLVALADSLEPYQHFLLRDRALWDSVWRHLCTRLPSQLPFATSFCRGQGLTRRLYGEVISPGPWYNLRHQQYQPNSSHGQHGYLLSTIYNILQASRTGVLKDSKGIIKYRVSSKQAITEMSESQNVLSEQPDEELITPRADSLGDITENSAQEQLEHLDQPENQEGEDSDLPEKQNHPEDASKTQAPLKTVKRKMKNVFKHIFGHSKSRKQEPAKEENKLEDTLETSSQKHVEIRENTIEQGSSKLPKLEVIPEQTSELDLKPDDSQSKINPADDSQQTVELEHVEETEDDTLQKEVGERLGDNISSDYIPMQMSINIKLKDKSERTRFGLAYVPDELPCLQVLFDDSFIGGSCLRINTSDSYSEDHRQIRILQCDFACQESLIFCIVTKHVIGYEEQFLNIKVCMTEESGEELEMVLVGRDVPQAPHSAQSGAFIRNVAPVCRASGTDFRELQKYILLNHPGFYVPVENSYDWIVRYYEVRMPNSRVTSINCSTGLSQGPILLGYLGICHRDETLQSPRGEVESVVFGLRGA